MMLRYIDNFLISPSLPRSSSTSEDCARATVEVIMLMEALELQRHRGKGEWQGSSRICHLGMLVETEEMKVPLTDEKVARRRVMPKTFLWLLKITGFS